MIKNGVHSINRPEKNTSCPSSEKKTTTTTIEQTNYLSVLK